MGGLSVIDGEQVSIDLVVFPLNAGNIQTFSSYPQGVVSSEFHLFCMHLISSEFHSYL